MRLVCSLFYFSERVKLALAKLEQEKAAEMKMNDVLKLREGKQIQMCYSWKMNLEYYSWKTRETTCALKAVRKVHKVNRHKRKEQLITA